MRQDKINDYHLTGSIHTLAIKSDGYIDNPMETVTECITVNSRETDGQAQSTTIINPNKLMGDLYSYDEFVTAMDTITAGMGISDYDVIRADMRYDSFDSEHYRRFAKMHRYLISALAVTYSVRNAYKSNNLFSGEQVSVAIKNRYFEAENYDKEWQSAGKDSAKSRLELRSKDGIEDIPTEFMTAWFRRLDKALSNLDQVQERYNQELIKLYLRDKGGRPCKFRTLTDFLIMYQDCIFTRRQLINLLSLIPGITPDQAAAKADNHKRRYGIEYFSQSDMVKAVAEIKRATTAFFEGA